MAELLLALALMSPHIEPPRRGLSQGERCVATCAQWPTTTPALLWVKPGPGPHPMAACTCLGEHVTDPTRIVEQIERRCIEGSRDDDAPQPRARPWRSLRPRDPGMP